MPKNKEEDLGFKEIDKMRALYHELYDALMFTLRNRIFEIGTYENEEEEK